MGRPRAGGGEVMAYNGWKNYETWAVALWIDNDEGSYRWSRMLVAEAAAGAGEGGETIAVADTLKDWQEAEMPELEASVWSDLLSAALGEVDWYEIAENYLSEIEDDEESEVE